MTADAPNDGWGCMTRRDAVQHLAMLALCTLPLPFSTCGPSRLSCTDLEKFHSEPEVAARIGHGYLQAYPRESDRAELCRLLLLELEPGTRNGWRERLRQMHRDDFAQEHIVEVHGWILSQTEARLCAVVALSI